MLGEDFETTGIPRECQRRKLEDGWESFAPDDGREVGGVGRQDQHIRSRTDEGYHDLQFLIHFEAGKVGRYKFSCLRVLCLKLGKNYSTSKPLTFTFEKKSNKPRGKRGLFVPPFIYFKCQGGALTS